LAELLAVKQSTLFVIHTLYRSIGFIELKYKQVFTQTICNILIIKNSHDSKK